MIVMRCDATRYRKLSSHQRAGLSRSLIAAALLVGRFASSVVTFVDVDYEGEGGGGAGWWGGGGGGGGGGGWEGGGGGRVRRCGEGGVTW